MILHMRIYPRNPLQKKRKKLARKPKRLLLLKKKLKRLFRPKF